MPKISVLIPVYNVEMYIRQCLDSAVGQTMQDIEIVCVNDCTPDGSFDICREYAQRDARVRLVEHSRNLGLLAARKTAVEAASGEYILFLDSDDWLEPQACDVLYEAARNSEADILQFGTIVEAVSEASDQIADVETILVPYCGRLRGRSIFYACFTDGKYGSSIWNKIYRSELCKKVYGQLPSDEAITMAEDQCAYFLLSWYADHFTGIDRKLYHYRFGAGITGQAHVSLASFRHICHQSVVVKICRDFLDRECHGDKRANAALEKLSEGLFSNSYWNWRDNLAEADRPAGFDSLVKGWGICSVVSALGQQYHDDPAAAADWIYGAECLRCTPRKVKRVAVYYYRYSMGGVERVVSVMIPALLAQGYKVTFITSEPPTSTDFFLPDGVERVNCTWSYKAEKYPQRARELHRILMERNIDMMLYNAASSMDVLFDAILCRGMDIPFVMAVHEYYGVLVDTMRPDILRKIKTFRFANELVSLSRVQRDFWQTVGCNAVYLPNPLPDGADTVHLSPLKNHDILWAGRIVPDKCYEDAVKILAEVCRTIPDARLLIAGTAGDPDDHRTLLRLIDACHMQNRVVLLGHVHDMYALYSQCSLYLLTSPAECCPMALAESKVAGLPCVMYDLPYIEMRSNDLGIAAVKMRDTRAAAEAIVSIFSDETLLHRLGAEARESVEPLLRLDYGAAWKEIIETLDAPDVGAAPPLDRSHKIILESLMGLYTDGAAYCRKLEAISGASAGQLANLEHLDGPNRKIELIHASASYRIGRFVTWLPRKFRGLLRCLQEHGLRYTLQRIPEHFGISMGVDLNKRQTQNIRPTQKPKAKIVTNTDFARKPGWLPAISVVLPVYNVEKYLIQAVDSILTQTFKNFELICVDDGSTDLSGSLLDKYSKEDPRVKVIHQNNQFLGCARNAGMRYIRGKYVLFLDSDDFFDPGLLKATYAAAERTDADIVLFRADIYHNDTGAFEPAPVLLEKSFFPHKKVFCAADLGDGLYRLTSPVVWTKLFRADFIGRYELKFVPFCNTEDLSFTYYAIALADRMTIVDKVLVHYRVGRADNLETVKVKAPTIFYDAHRHLQAELFQARLYGDDIQKALINKFVDSTLYTIRTLNSEVARKLVKNYLYDEMRFKMDLAAQPEDLFSVVESDNYQQYCNIIVEIERERLAIRKRADIRVSIIVPVYNGETYLRTCLDSILNQSLRDIEVICVDDGSTDGTPNILREYADADGRVTVLTQPNLGAGVARNNGMTHAAGDFLMFLDSDDFFEPDMLEALYRQCIEDNADICVCNYDSYNSKLGTFTPMRGLRMNMVPDKRPFNHHDCPKNILCFCDPAAWIKMFHTSYIQNLHVVFQDNHCANDLYFSMVALSEAGRITVVDRPLVHYRTVISSSLQSNNQKSPLDFCRALFSLKQELIHSGTFPEIEDSFVEMAFNNVMYNLDKLTDYPDAYRQLYLKLKYYYLDAFGITGKPLDAFADLHYRDAYRRRFLAGRDELPEKERTILCDL